VSDHIEMLKELYHREVNFSLTTFWDSGYTAKLGDELNGFVAESNFNKLEEAINFLREQLEIHFPPCEHDFTACNSPFVGEYDMCVKCGKLKG